MTVEVALVLSFVSVGFGVLSTVFSISRNNRKDTQETAEEKAATNTMLSRITRDWTEKERKSNNRRATGKNQLHKKEA